MIILNTLEQMSFPAAKKIIRESLVSIGQMEMMWSSSDPEKLLEKITSAGSLSGTRIERSFTADTRVQNPDAATAPSPLL
jgi:hypothetical protein